MANKKLEHLIHKYGTQGVAFEQAIYRVAEHFSANYDGGFWESKTLTDDEGNEIDGFYLELSDDDEYEIRNCQNGYSSGNMDAKTFSLAIFTFTCNLIGSQAYEHGDEDFANDLFDLQYFCQQNALKILGCEKKHAQYYWFLD